VGYIAPVAGNITFPFGVPDKYTGGYHDGVDIGAIDHSNVVASDSGRIVYEGVDGLNGNTIRIQHPNGDVTVYAHLSKFIQGIGSQVLQNQAIALSGGGATDPGRGNATGPNLHFQIIRNGKPIDPAPLIGLSALNQPSTMQPAPTARPNRASAGQATPEGIKLAAQNGATGIPAIDKLIGTTSFFTSGNGWKRIGQGLLGTGLITIAIIRLTGNSTMLQSIPKVV